MLIDVLPVDEVANKVEDKVANKVEDEVEDEVAPKHNCLSLSRLVATALRP